MDESFGTREPCSHNHKVLHEDEGYSHPTVIGRGASLSWVRFDSGAKSGDSSNGSWSCGLVRVQTREVT